MSVSATAPAVTAASGRRLLRVAIVGAGFSGIAMALALKRSGHGDEMVIIDKAEEFGGTWRDNIYPGCACDVPSHLYSLEGEPHDWPAFYADQPDIQRYILDVVARHGLRRHARLGNGVAGQTWDDTSASWHITLEDGHAIEADVVVNGVGPLSKPVVPDIPGLGTFAGPSFHSAQWDADVDVAGKRVGIIGTGASAVQIVPTIVDQVAHMTVFQRTPSWVLPRMARTFTPFERFVLRNVPAAQRAVRGFVYLTVEHLVWRILAQDQAARHRPQLRGADGRSTGQVRRLGHGIPAFRGSGLGLRPPMPPPTRSPPRWRGATSSWSGHRAADRGTSTNRASTTTIYPGPVRQFQRRMSRFDIAAYTTGHRTRCWRTSGRGRVGRRTPPPRPQAGHRR